MKTEQAAFAERLHRLLAEKRFEASPVELAPLLARYGVSVTPQAVSGWLNGSFMPRLGNLRALAALLEVDLHALQAGGKPRHGVKEPAPTWVSDLSGKDALAFREFTTLPAAQRKLVRELIAALAAAVTRERS
ncbi:MAG: helix-turn-helix domain-containing protein [Lysobacterales bacterium]